MRALSICLIVMVILLNGCSSVTNLKQLSIGMTKEEVISAMGKDPTEMEGVIKNQYGQDIEIWKYKLSRGIMKKRRNYRLFFFDKKLVEWGIAGRWSKEIERISKVDFSQKQTLSQE